MSGRKAWLSTTARSNLSSNSAVSAVPFTSIPGLAAYSSPIAPRYDSPVASFCAGIRSVEPGSRGSSGSWIPLTLAMPLHRVGSAYSR